MGQLDYYGRLEPGWQLEAYSGAQLVAFDSIGASGDYSITLPVGYGENPVDFVAYGPDGQVRRFNQTYRVVSEQLPYKQLEYGLAAGECVVDAVHQRVQRRPALRPLAAGDGARGRGGILRATASATSSTPTPWRPAWSATRSRSRARRSGAGGSAARCGSSPP